MFRDETLWSLLFFFLLLSLLVFLHSHHFYVEEILVSDILYFSEEELLTVELPLGENLFKIHRTSLSRDLLLNPLVKTVEIVRRLPRTLFFKLEEQRPLAYIKEDESMFLIGCMGVVMRMEESPGYFSLPTVYGYSLLADARVPPPVEEILPVLNNLSPSFLEEVDGIEILEDRITLYLSYGIKAFVGRDITTRQGEVLAVIYEELDTRRDVEYIDLRYGMHPVIKYAD